MELGLKLRCCRVDSELLSGFREPVYTLLLEVKNNNRDGEEGIHGEDDDPGRGSEAGSNRGGRCAPSFTPIEEHCQRSRQHDAKHRNESEEGADQARLERGPSRHTPVGQLGLRRV